MGYIKTYRGARLDLEFYKSKATINFPVEVFNDDESEFDLTVYWGIFLKVFHKIHGTLVLTLDESDGQITLYSPADNFVIIDVSDSESLLRPKEYWYECYGIREDDEQELIFFGVFKVL